MKRSPDKWLQDLEQDHERIRNREQRTHYLWVEPGATAAEIEDACNREIAEGAASTEDRFVVFSWRAD